MNLSDPFNKAWTYVKCKCKNQRFYRLIKYCWTKCTQLYFLEILLHVFIAVITFLSSFFVKSSWDWTSGHLVSLGRPKTCWRDYISLLAWERLEIPQEELESVTTSGFPYPVWCRHDPVPDKRCIDGWDFCEMLYTVFGPWEL